MNFDRHLWYVQRLIAMPPYEIFSRIGFQLRKLFWRHKVRSFKLFRSCLPETAWRQQGLVFCQIDPSCVQSVHLIDEAIKYLGHTWCFFSLQNVTEPAIDWHFDPSTKKSAPKKFSYDINYRDASIGDAKVIWEKSRHHHLTVLSAAYALTKDEKFAHEVASQLLDWISSNPCCIGINWTHSLELGIRLIAWIWCERLLRGSAHYTTAFGPQSPIWLCIGQHQEVIAHTYSCGSSANNHLIGEMAGLFCASIAFPIYKKTRNWRKLSQRILEREIVKQTFPSGINREMAFGYHLFVTEFFLLSLYESLAVSIRFSESFHSLLKKMLETIIHLTEFDRTLPRFGDGDDGMAVQLQGYLQPRANWILQLGSVLLNTAYPYRDATALPLLFMGYIHDFSKPTSMVLPEKKSFEDAGIYILTNNRNTPGEIFLLAKAGPLGYLSLAAHGHADALSFTLSVGGNSIFVDPGTYSYFTHPEWRNYFRGTHSHNTVVVDSANQSMMQGIFLYSRKARTVVTQWSINQNSTIVSGYHDGYKKNLGCIHHRSIKLADTAITIEDSITGKGSRSVLLCYHCAPECSILQEDRNRMRIRHGDASVDLVLPEKFEITVNKGEYLSGWFSPSFKVKVPAYAILSKALHELPCSFTTTIEINHEC